MAVVPRLRLGRSSSSCSLSSRRSTSCVFLRRKTEGQWRVCARGGGGDEERELAELEARAAEMRAELAKRKIEEGELSVDTEEEGKSQAQARSGDVRGGREAGEGGKRGRGKTYTAMKIADGKMGIEEAFGYVNRGQRGISEVEILDRSDDTDPELLRRNLLVGGGGAAALIILANIRLPQPKPSRPTWFYILSALRLRSQIPGLIEYAETGDVEKVKEALDTLKKQGVVADLRAAARSLKDGKQQEKAEGIAADIRDYLDQADYTNYFDSFTLTPQSGVAISKFSVDALKAAALKVDEFIGIMPADERALAQAQIFT